MRRKIYFLIEKLEIKRSERIAVTLFLTTLVILSTVAALIEPAPNYDKEEYEELTKIFHQKSKALQSEEEIILARYEPSLTTSSKKMELDNAEKSELIPADTTTETNSTIDSAKLININKATKEQLQQLPGIGPAYASRIITWRQENGDFTEKNQLLEIRGIGEKRLAKIKPLISLE